MSKQGNVDDAYDNNNDDTSNLAAQLNDLSMSTNQNNNNDDDDENNGINLFMLVHENKGFKITNVSKLGGRCVMATANFDRILSVALTESPTIITPPDDYLEIIEQFQAAPIEIQQGIMDMACQPLDSEIGQSLLEPAKLIHMLGAMESSTLEKIHTLLCIHATNAHQFKQDLTALFIFGSKLSHSCQPNVGYRSVYGKLEFLVLRPIYKGDIVASSYLPNLFETPTHERRKSLQQTKSFYCECERCMGPDYCRCALCPHCKSIQPSDPTIIVPGGWKCHTCGNKCPKIAKIESTIYNQLSTLESNLEKAMENGLPSNLPVTPSEIQDYIDETKTQLSPTHYLTIRSYRLLSQVSTTHAYQKIQQLMTGKGPKSIQKKIVKHFQQSIMAGIIRVQCCECVAANCTSAQCHSNFTTSCNNNNNFAHAPIYDNATTMWHICEDLQQLQVHEWPKNASNLLKRYIPVLFAKYGQDNQTIRKLITQVI